MSGTTIVIVIVSVVVVLGLAVGLGALAVSKSISDKLLTRRSAPSRRACPPKKDGTYTELIGGKCFKPCDAGYEHSDTNLYHFECVRQCPSDAPLDPETGDCKTAAYARNKDTDRFGGIYGGAHCQQANGGLPCQKVGVYWWIPCRSGYEPWEGSVLAGPEKHKWCYQPCPVGTSRKYNGQCKRDWYSGPKGALGTATCPPLANPTFTDLIGNRCYEPCPEGYVPSGTKCKKIIE